MEINIILGILILILSIFQSIFGIGLLALGTPLLLIYGFTFIETLFFLLPCSILVSTITFVLISRKYNNYFDQEVIKYIFFFSIPGIIIGLIIILFYEININFKILIGSAIIISIFLQKIIKKQLFLKIEIKRAINFVIGIIHGISNMGGSFLSIYLSSIYKDKFKVRYHLTFAYIFFALSQLLFLNLTYSELSNFYNIRLLFLFSIIGALLGNILEEFLNNKIFFKILNTCILITAFVLIIKSINEILY